MPAHRALSPSDWVTVITEYRDNGKHPKEIAERFGVSDRTIRNGLKERNIVRESKVAETVDDEAEEARREREARVKQARSLEERYVKYNEAIVTYTMKIIIEAEKSKTLKLKKDEMRVLKGASDIVSQARRENWEILRIQETLVGEDTLPDLNVGEYTNDEIERIRQANEEAYRDGVEDEDDDEFVFDPDDVDDAGEDE